MNLEAAIAAAGLPGLVVGAALEGDTVAFLGGVLAHRGFFSPEAAALAVSAGGAVSDNLFFALGRRAGQGALARRLLSRRQVTALRTRLERAAVPATLGFRFVWGMKTAGAVLIGTTAMPWRRFLLLDALGAALWAHSLVWLGYLSGHAVAGIFGTLRLHWHLAVAASLFVAASVALHLILRRRSP